MQKSKFEFKSDVEAIHTMTSSFANNDWELCKQAIIFWVEDWEPDIVDDIITALSRMDDSYKTAMFFFTSLVKTGLCDEPEGTILRKFYIRLCEFIITNQPPEMDEKLDEIAHKFFPCWYERWDDYFVKLPPKLEVIKGGKEENK